MAEIQIPGHHALGFRLDPKGGLSIEDPNQGTVVSVLLFVVSGAWPQQRLEQVQHINQHQNERQYCAQEPWFEGEL